MRYARIYGVEATPTYVMRYARIYGVEATPTYGLAARGRTGYARGGNSSKWQAANC